MKCFESLDALDGFDFTLRFARPSSPPAESGSPPRFALRCAFFSTAYTKWLGPHASSPAFTICLMTFFTSRSTPDSLRSAEPANALAIAVSADEKTSTAGIHNAQQRLVVVQLGRLDLGDMQAAQNQRLEHR